MALVNFSQSYATHGANPGCRFFSVECTGDLKKDLYSDLNNRILDGKLLYNLCPALKPGDVIRVFNRDGLGNVSPSGYSYTVIAGNTNRPSGSSDGYLYAVWHQDDEHVRFFQIDSLGSTFSLSKYVPYMSLFIKFGGVLLDKNDQYSQFNIRDGYNTNDVGPTYNRHGFDANSPRGTLFAHTCSYYSNKFIVENEFEEVDDFNKRFVFYYIFKPKDYIELTYVNNDVRTRNHSALTEYKICGELAKAYAYTSCIGDAPTDTYFRLKNDTADATNRYTFGQPEFVVVGGDGRIFKGTILSFVQTQDSAKDSSIGGYVKCFFNPVP